MSTEPSKDVKETADQVLDIVEQAVIEYLVRFLASVGQTITKEQAGTMLSKIGIKIALKNGTLG